MLARIEKLFMRAILSFRPDSFMDCKQGKEVFMHTKTMKLMSAAVISAIAGTLTVFSSGCQCHAQDQSTVEVKKTIPEKAASPKAKKQSEPLKAKTGTKTETTRSTKETLSKTDWKFTVSTNQPKAIYRKGENVVFTVNLLKDGAAFPDGTLKYRISENGNWGKWITVPSGKPLTVTKTSNKPAWFAIEATAHDKDGKAIKNPKTKNRNLKVTIGAMVAPEEIREAAAEPADFDLFWKAQRETLNAVPVKATRTKVDVPNNLRDKVDCYDVKVDCAGAKPVSGYLVLPKNAKKGSLPAIVSYHGAGVRSANKPFGYGRRAIAFDVNAHGIPNGQPKEFYSDLNKGELKGYSHRNKNNRDQFYFKEMFLRVMRALDYVKTLPEWNGKVLIVTGGSQGGGQALVAAALDPQVTLCVANVPAIGDHAGRLVGRRPGWPQLMNSPNTTPANQQIIKASGYFDHNYFAKRIKCETYTGTGFVDFVCPPTSVYAAYNNLPAKTKKFIQTTPTAGHGAPLSIGYKRINQVLGK